MKSRLNKAQIKNYGEIKQAMHEQT